jgi:hypothetical protein
VEEKHNNNYEGIMAAATVRQSSLRAYVHTQKGEEVRVEEKGEEELELLNDPLALANTGILLMCNKLCGPTMLALCQTIPFLTHSFSSSCGDIRQGGV